MTSIRKRLLVAFLTLGVTLILKLLDFHQTWITALVIELARWVVGVE